MLGTEERRIVAQMKEVLEMHFSRHPYFEYSITTTAEKKSEILIYLLEYNSVISVMPEIEVVYNLKNKLFTLIVKSRQVYSTPSIEGVMLYTAFSSCESLLVFHKGEFDTEKLDNQIEHIIDGMFLKRRT